MGSKCECGRLLNLTDWHYGSCVNCGKTIDYKTWKVTGDANK